MGHVCWSSGTLTGPCGMGVLGSRHPYFCKFCRCDISLITEQVSSDHVVLVCTVEPVCSSSRRGDSSLSTRLLTTFRLFQLVSQGPSLSGVWPESRSRRGSCLVGCGLLPGGVRAPAWWGAGLSFMALPSSLSAGGPTLSFHLPGRELPGPPPSPRPPRVLIYGVHGRPAHLLWSVFSLSHRELRPLESPLSASPEFCFLYDGPFVRFPWIHRRPLYLLDPAWTWPGLSPLSLTGAAAFLREEVFRSDVVI